MAFADLGNLFKYLLVDMLNLLVRMMYSGLATAPHLRNAIIVVVLYSVCNIGKF